MTRNLPLGCGVQTGCGAVWNELRPRSGSTFAHHRCRGGRVGRHHGRQFTPASTAVPGASVLTLTARL
jgi:hypothetical protein